MPIGPGRRENVEAAIAALNEQVLRPKLLVLVCDGEDAWLDSADVYTTMPSYVLNLPKHQPGMEQPRNAGVRRVDEMRHEFHDMYGDISHIWFLDSDIITLPTCLAEFEMEMEAGGQEGVYIGPYDWLNPGEREPNVEMRNDPAGVPPPGRWGMFDEHEPGTRYTEDLSKGLGCFSGNLVWQIDDFIRVGGFWDEIHHGRCEDGELGMRAVAMGIPIGIAVNARGWHLCHDRNMDWINAANQRDVPMLNERHPWMEGRCVCGRPAEEHRQPNPTQRPCHGFVPESAEEPDTCESCGTLLSGHVRGHLLDGKLHLDCEGFKKAMFVVDEDGKRFNIRCSCGWEGNTALIWTHRAEGCRGD